MATGTTASYTYAETAYANPHAVTAIGATTTTYDKSGNTTESGPLRYIWDYNNRLTSADGASGTATTSYLYTEGALGGWNDWSWNSTRTFTSSEEVGSGTHSLKVAYSAPYGGLYLSKSSGSIDVTPFDTLSLMIHGGTNGGQTPELELYGAGDTLIRTITLLPYIDGNTLLPDTWHEATIPLSLFTATTTTIKGLVIMNSTATTLHFDNIRFEKGTTKHTYNHQNQRLTESTGTSTTLYPSKYWNKTATTTTRHIFTPQGELIATLSGGTGTSTTFLHPDHLGGTNVTSDTDGFIKEVSDYYPYGAKRIADLQSGTNEQRTFTGHEYSSTPDLTYANARYYNQALGKFLSQDPIFLNMGVDPRTAQLLLDPQQMNSYGYARGNPIALVDASGEIAVLPGIYAAIEIYGAFNLGFNAGEVLNADLLFRDNYSSSERSSARFDLGFDILTEVVGVGVANDLSKAFLTLSSDLLDAAQSLDKTNKDRRERKDRKDGYQILNQSAVPTRSYSSLGSGSSQGYSTPTILINGIVIQPPGYSPGQAQTLFDAIQDIRDPKKQEEAARTIQNIFGGGESIKNNF